MAKEQIITPAASRPQRFYLPVIALVFITVLLSAGCGGDDAGTGTSAGTPVALGTLQRPSEGEVILIDDLSDMMTPEGERINAALWVDINQVSIKREGAQLKFEIQVSDQLPPAKPNDILGVEWGFLLNTNDDDKPDWGLYCAFPQADWSCGLYNMETRERLTGDTFPGTVTHEGTALTWTIDPAAFGSDGSFKWVAYTDAARPKAGTTTTVDRAGDRAPNNGWPLGSWLDYP